MCGHPVTYLSHPITIPVTEFQWVSWVFHTEFQRFLPWRLSNRWWSNGRPMARIHRPRLVQRSSQRCTHPTQRRQWHWELPRRCRSSWNSIECQSTGTNMIWKCCRDVGIWVSSIYITIYIYILHSFECASGNLYRSHGKGFCFPNRIRQPKTCSLRTP